MFSCSRNSLPVYTRRIFRLNKLNVTQLAVNPTDSEYTASPVYPEICEDHQKRKREQWHEKIKSTPTVEEKIIKMNMPRYYGFKMVQMNTENLPYNCLPITQHYTRTLFEEYDKLPSALEGDAVNQQMESFIKCFSNSVKETIEYSHEFFRSQHGSADHLSPEEQEKILGQLIVEQINRTLMNSLTSDVSHLSDVEVDLNPRHEAFWIVGGVDPPKNVVKSKLGRSWNKGTAYVPIDRYVQYSGEPYLAIRHKLPLPPIMPLEACTSSQLAERIPFYKYDARSLGFKTTHRHGTNIPGFWPGSSSGFGLLSIQPRHHMTTRSPKYGLTDFQETLHAQGIQSSFGWLLAQAAYNGFTTFNDITYPMVTQTMITNGRQWSFYQYQMNTVIIHSDHVHNNPKVNFCWGTKEMNLFHEVNSQGQCVGFNDDVLKYLIGFYVKAPKDRQIDLKPYLGKGTEYVANIEHDDKRRFLERIFKHLSSNRPRHLEIPEIYLWETLYKIKHKTRPMEPRRRFFELNINPWKRTLDQHDPEYLPKVLRPDGPKTKPRFYKTYYP